MAIVVVIDPSAGVLELAEQVLRAAGHYVLATRSSDEALEVVRRVDVDAVVADQGNRASASGGFVHELEKLRPDLRLIALTPLNRLGAAIGGT
jgi:DNA-binding NtrC family response regulator